MGVVPVPSRMSVHRVLVRHGLIEPGPRKRQKDSYLRWERDEPATAQRRASNTGIIMIAVQKIALGRIHARQVVTVHVAAGTIAVALGGSTRTFRRTTTQPVRSIKAAQSRKAAQVFQGAPTLDGPEDKCSAGDAL
jgi:hypothetical protein